jgi:hypothetical protein
VLLTQQDSAHSFISDSNEKQKDTYNTLRNIIDISLAASAPRAI